MASTIFGISGMVVGIGGLIISFVVLMSNKKKSDKESGEQEGVILSELDHIKNTTEEIKHKLEKRMRRIWGSFRSLLSLKLL